MPKAGAPVGWSLRTAGPQSETALRLIESDQSWAMRLSVDIDDWVARYPSEVKAGVDVRRRLLEDGNHTFRGAVWELFWFATMQAMDHDIAVEYSDHAQDASGRQPSSVDFMLRTRDIAIEVTSVNERNADVKASYWVEDILDAIQRHVFAPGVVLHMRVREVGSNRPDLDRLAASVQSWFFEVVSNGVIESSRLRLDLGWQGWKLDFTSHDLPGGRKTYVSSTGPVVQSDCREQVRDILTKKRVKKSAVPERPLLVAVATPGRLAGSDRWDRANVLAGDDLLIVGPGLGSRRGRAENGFLFGAQEWRNSEVSAVAFTSDHLPRFGESEIEIWVNGGAAHAMPLEPFFELATIVAARGDQLMERAPGLDSDWVPAATL